MAGIRAFRQRPWQVQLFLCLCYAAVAAGIVLRFAHVFGFNPLDSVWSDPQRHWEQGTDVLRDDPLSQIDAPAYQLYIAVLAKLTLGIPALVAFYTALLAAATPWIWYRFLRYLLPTREWALAGWALLSLLPGWITIYAYFMQETLFLPLLGAALWATWRCAEKRGTAAFAVMIVLWAAAGLTRGIAIPLAALCATWLWFSQSHKPKNALTAVLILGFILGPLAWRSYNTMNVVAPHGISWMNRIYAESGARSIELTIWRDDASWYYIFQSPSLEVRPLEPLSDWQSRRIDRASLFINVRKGRADWQRALDKYALEPGEYPAFLADNLLLLFFSESWPNSNRDRALGAINYHARWVWSVLAVAALLLTLLLRRRLRGRWLLSSLLLVWFLFQAMLPISVNEGRYRMPFEGLVISQLLLLGAQARRVKADSGRSAMR